MHHRFTSLSLALASAALVLLAGCGKQEAPAPAAAPAATAPAEPATPAPAAPAADTAAATDSATAPADAPAAVQTADLELGRSVYNKTCALCHAAGVGGAPKPGDKADWGPRAAQGIDTLHKHAIEGFTGQKGMMPPKGGNAALTDAEVKAAVAHMLSK